MDDPDGGAPSESRKAQFCPVFAAITTTFAPSGTIWLVVNRPTDPIAGTGGFP